MKRTVKKLFWSVGIGACLAGCRTTQQVLRDYEAHLTTGDYEASLQEFADLAAKGDGSELMWRLMSAHSLYMLDRREAAIQEFDRAERVMQNQDAASVFSQSSGTGLAMMTNDKAFNYDGGGLDRIFTCLYRGIDFLVLGRSEDARVEFNRAAQYQDNWFYDRRRDIDAAAERLSSEATAYQQKNNTKPVDHSATVSGALANGDFAATIRNNTGYDPSSSGNLAGLKKLDYYNAYVSHVTGIFRWLDGNDGRDALRATVSVRPKSPGLARDLADSERGKPVNQVWIWVEDGLCPAREEWRVDLPLVLMPFVGRYLPYAGMALPKLRERAYGATMWKVSANGGQVQMGELENVDHLVRTEYDVYMRGALTREITRCIVKAGVQVALGVTADNVSDRNTQLALKLSQIAAAWAASTTAADVRSWTSLPKRVLAMRLDRPADGHIVVWADGQQIALDVAEGNTMVFIRKPGPQAMPVIKSVTFRR